MTRDSIGLVLIAALLALSGGFLLGTGLMSQHIFLLLVGFTALAYLLGRWRMSASEQWLPGLLALAMLAKLAGSSLRYYVLEVVYNGSGDGGRYHNFGLLIADTWRSLVVPDMTTVGFGSEGTRFTAWMTGLIYAPYEPSQLGGFWMLSILAFVGQFFFYLAFRAATPDHRWKRYAILIFFWPTLVYWPSSIGKEALLIFFLGIGSWAVARVYRRYQVRWLPLIGAAAFLASLVRVHVAAVFAGAILGGLLLDRRKEDAPPAFNRLLVLMVVVAVGVPIAFGVADRFGVDLANVSSESLDPVFSDIGDMTEQGGSAVSGGVIRTPLDIPAGILKVLFRPLPIEAGNAQMLIASLEGTALLGLVLWQAPAMFRNRKKIWRSPYLLYCAIFSFLFIWAWSSILNLGILARQRSLVFPMLFAVIAALGWDKARTSRKERASMQINTSAAQADPPATSRLVDSGSDFRRGPDG